MTGDGFKILTRTPVPKLPRVPPTITEDIEGYINFKEQYMNRSTFCEIKYRNRLGFFLKAGYIIGVGFKILTRRPVPKSPPPPRV